MAHSKLHIICGNCGSNDMFNYQIKTDIDDTTNENYQIVYISCENCGTIHDLKDNAKKEIK